MASLASFTAETLSLKNRVGCEVDVDVVRLQYRQRDYVILKTTQNLPARHLLKSAEHFAHQLLALMAVTPEDVDFIQYQPGEEPEWLRWGFQWVGQTPLKPISYGLTAASQKSFLEPLLSQGQPVSIRENMAAVA